MTENNSEIEVVLQNYTKAEMELKSLYLQLAEVKSLSETHTKGADVLATAVANTAKQGDALKVVQDSLNEALSRIGIATNELRTSKLTLDQLAMAFSEDSFKEMAQQTSALSDSIKEIVIELRLIEDQVSKNNKNLLMFLSVILISVVTLFFR